MEHTTCLPCKYYSYMSTVQILQLHVYCANTTTFYCANTTFARLLCKYYYYMPTVQILLLHVFGANICQYFTHRICCKIIAMWMINFPVYKKNVNISLYFTSVFQNCSFYTRFSPFMVQNHLLSVVTYKYLHWDPPYHASNSSACRCCYTRSHVIDVITMYSRHYCYRYYNC